MNEKGILKRKIKLKGQAITLIREEREALRRKLFLLELRDFYGSQIGASFDQKLSSKIDAVNLLLDMA